MQLELGSSSLDQVWPRERCALTVLLSGSGYFWILLVGQVVSSILNVLEWGAPSYISAVWFPPNERAFATTMVAATAPQASDNFSVFLMSLGCAVGGNIVVSVAESFGSPSRQHRHGVQQDVGVQNVPRVPSVAGRHTDANVLLPVGTGRICFNYSAPHVL